MTPSGKDSSKTKKTGTNVPEGERMSTLSEKLRDQDRWADDADRDLMLEWADEAAALEHRITAVEAFVKFMDECWGADEVEVKYIIERLRGA